MPLYHPPGPDLQGLADWTGRVSQILAPIYVSSKVIDLASVTANSVSIQSFTFAGLTSDWVPILCKPTRTTGLNVVQVWIESDDVLSVAIENTTGGDINPGSETYKLVAIKV